MLYKFQRPLFSTDPKALLQVLIYNQDRSHMGETPMTKADIDTVFDEGEYKVFWHGTKDENGKIVLEKKLAGKDWPAW